MGSYRRDDCHRGNFSEVVVTRVVAEGMIVSGVVATG